MMPFLVALIIGITLVVVWVVMRQNNPLPMPGQMAPNGQPVPVAQGGNPQAAGDAAIAAAVAGAVGQAFALVGTIVNNSQ